MHDTGKVVAGLALFAAVMLFPFWWGVLFNKALPDVPTPEGTPPCVESAVFMRTGHMDLLDDWRDAVVRGGVRRYTSGNDGRIHEMSLSNSCLGCHDKTESCDACHGQLNVAPHCWDCHVDENRPEVE
jgi:hypothetical protein